MTCENCFKFGDCLKSGETPHYAEDGCHNDVENRCKHFKNKADYAEVKHGHWIKSGNEKKCSVCDFVYYSNNDEWNGCPNCLSKMDGERK